MWYSCGVFRECSFDMVDSGKNEEYFCQIGDVDHRLNAICPLKHLVTLIQSTPDETFFPPSSKVLTKHMKSVACFEKIVKPHSLRIGRHTFIQSTDWMPISVTIPLVEKLTNLRRRTTVRPSHQTIYNLRRFFTRSFKETCQT